MTQEEKDLLLIDLCARLPYGVYVYIERSWKTEKIDYICASQQKVWLDDADNMVDISEIKPFLRPMSSMTEEENKELVQLLNNDNLFTGDISRTVALHCSVCTDYFNKKMFDYRGLIEKGLALEAPQDLYDNEFTNG